MAACPDCQRDFPEYDWCCHLAHASKTPDDSPGREIPLDMIDSTNEGINSSPDVAQRPRYGSVRVWLQGDTCPCATVWKIGGDEALYAASLERFRASQKREGGPGDWYHLRSKCGGNMNWVPAGALYICPNDGTQWKAGNDDPPGRDLRPGMIPDTSGAQNSPPAAARDPRIGDAAVRRKNGDLEDKWEQAARKGYWWRPCVKCGGNMNWIPAGGLYVCPNDGNQWRAAGGKEYCQLCRKFDHAPGAAGCQYASQAPAPQVAEVPIPHWHPCSKCGGNMNWVPAVAAYICPHDGARREGDIPEGLSCPKCRKAPDHVPGGIHCAC